jgi:hypothetical protein
MIRRFLLGCAVATIFAPTTLVLAGELYDQGLRDRTSWENWFRFLSGDIEIGAEYWAGQRSLPYPGNCLGTPDFQRGCNEAKARLTPFDTLRKSQPEYRAGWNAYVTPPAPVALTPPSTPWEREEQVQQQEIATRALEAENARRSAEVQQREIAARAARAEAERARAEVARQKAEQEASDARAEARLKYEEQIAGQVKKEKGRGYTPITFEDYLLDKKDLEKKETKIAIHGFYKAVGHLEILLRSSSSDANNDDETIILLTEKAERDTRKYFLTCRDNGGACSVTVLGSITNCARTDRYGAKTADLCFAVDDSWNVAEPTQS